MGAHIENTNKQRGVASVYTWGGGGGGREMWGGKERKEESIQGACVCWGVGGGGGVMSSDCGAVWSDESKVTPQRQICAERPSPGEVSAVCNGQ